MRGVVANCQRETPGSTLLGSPAGSLETFF